MTWDFTNSILAELSKICFSMMSWDDRRKQWYKTRQKAEAVQRPTAQSYADLQKRRVIANYEKMLKKEQRQRGENQLNIKDLSCGSAQHDEGEAGPMAMSMGRKRKKKKAKFDKQSTDKIEVSNINPTDEKPSDPATSDTAARNEESEETTSSVPEIKKRKVEESTKETVKVKAAREPKNFFTEAEDQWLKRKEEKEKEMKEKECLYQERQKALNKYKKKKDKNYRRQMKRNAHGQPIMTGLMHNLLDKIKKSKR